MRSINARRGAALFTLLAIAAGCSSDDSSLTTTAAVETTTTTTAATGRDATTTSFVAEPTMPASTAPQGACGGYASMPADVADPVTITADLDGDLAADTVTSYSELDGPHVHAILTSGVESDVALTGLPSPVSISAEDIDHAAGAQTPPPVVVMAVGPGGAGGSDVATVTFLSPDGDGCLRQWEGGGAPFSVTIQRSETHVVGLRCEGTAGSIHYGIVEANRQDDQWLVSTSELRHNGTLAVITPLGDEVAVPHSADFAVQTGDIVNCGHATLG